MRDDDRTAVLRQSLARAERPGAGKGFPVSLKREVAAFVQSQRARGRSYASLAAGLGVSATTLTRWEQSDEPAAFAAVAIVAEEVVGGALVVHGPSGMRIEGASIDDVVRLWARLR
jgi:hypothetical protein